LLVAVAAVPMLQAVAVLVVIEHLLAQVEVVLLPNPP
jgi:hypothetical protein